MWFCLLISKRSRFLNWLPVIGNDICLKMSQGAPFFNGMLRCHGSAARHRDWEHLWFLTGCASEYHVEWPIPTDVMEIMAIFILHWKWCWDFEDQSSVPGPARDPLYDSTLSPQASCFQISFFIMGIMTLVHLKETLQHPFQKSSNTHLGDVGDIRCFSSTRNLSLQ